MSRRSIKACLRFSRPIHRSLSSKPQSPEIPTSELDSQKGVLQFIDTGTSAGATKTGRSWRTSEFRLKSYDDLHKLWYVLLKERNILLTEKAWCKTNRRYWVNGGSNLFKVKQSMARLQGVVGERNRAYKVKRSREALQAEAEGRGLGDAINQRVVDAQQVVTRPPMSEK